MDEKYLIINEDINEYLSNQAGDFVIEILTTREMTKMMSSVVGNYEGEIYNVYRQGRSTPAVPLVIIGIEP